MIPLLYEKTYRGVGDDKRIGALPSWLECKVTEERNGEFYLEGSLPAGAPLVDELAIDRIIMCAPCPKRPPEDEEYPFPSYEPLQPFRIKRLYKESDDVVHVVAPHVSYQLSSVIMTGGYPDAQGVTTVQDAFNTRLNSINGTDHSILYCTPPLNAQWLFLSDCESTSTINPWPDKPMSVRAWLAQVRDLFGGDFEWNGWQVRLRDPVGQNPRGIPKDIPVRYAENLESVQYDTDTEELVTGYYGYYSKDGTYKSAYFPKAGASNFAYVRIEVVDLSNLDNPTQEDVNAATYNYAESQNKDSLPTSITVTAVPEALQNVFLCDSVRVIHPVYHINQTATVVQTVYDPIRERYISITIGEIQKGITDTIAQMLARYTNA